MSSILEWEKMIKNPVGYVMFTRSCYPIRKFHHSALDLWDLLIDYVDEKVLYHFSLHDSPRFIFLHGSLLKVFKTIVSSQQGRPKTLIDLAGPPSFNYHREASPQVSRRLDDGFIYNTIIKRTFKKRFGKQMPVAARKVMCKQVRYSFSKLLLTGVVCWAK